MSRIFQARFHFFKSLLALDGAFGIIEYFEIDQPVDFIFLGKAFRLFQAMLSPSLAPSSSRPALRGVETSEARS